ncbi:MAG: hydrogenase maturation endopeptidase [Deltaproteobacteria bacterium]|nr:MAG: hydrogenase maturation endopeptidase [Deltaproteobacteria bacterium]
MTAPCSKKIGILGVGNLLLSDEGFGSHFLDYLSSNFEIPAGITVFDGGTAGIMLAPFVEDHDIIFVIDVVSPTEGEPGSIHCFTDQEVRSGNIQTRMSPHQVGLLEILDLCNLRGLEPEHIEMFTVVPQDLSTRIGLSPLLETKLPEVMSLLASALERQGVHLTPKAAPKVGPHNAPDYQTMAQRTHKRQHR